MVGLALRRPAGPSSGRNRSPPPAKPTTAAASFSPCSHVPLTLLSSSGGTWWSTCPGGGAGAAAESIEEARDDLDVYRHESVRPAGGPAPRPARAGARGGDAGARGRARLRRARRGLSEHGRPPGGDLRGHPSPASVLQPADQGGPEEPVGPDRLRGRRGRELDQEPGRAHLHLQAAQEREVPRRQAAHLAGREGELRQDHLPARGRGQRSQGHVLHGEERRGARSRHRGLPAEVRHRGVHSRAGQPLQLDLRGRHPGPRHPLVRDPRDGQRPVQVQGVRGRLPRLGRPQP